MMNIQKSANASRWMRTALLAVLAAVAATGCNNNEMPEAGNNPGKPNGKMTIHVATGEKAPGARVAYDDDKVGTDQGNVLTWQTGDRLAVVLTHKGRYMDHADDYLYQGEDGDTFGSFEGTKIDIIGGNWAVYYPHTVTVNADDGTVTLPMTGQTQAADGSTAHLRKHMLLEATGLTYLNDDFALKMKSSIMKFDLSGIPAEVGTLKTLTWEVETASGTARELTLTFPAADVDGAVIFGNNGKSDLTAYLSFLPTEMSLMANGRCTVILEGEKTYIATMDTSANGKTYEAGKRYTTTIDNTSGTAEWKEAIIVKTMIPSDAKYNFNGREMQIGTWQADDSSVQTTIATATIVNGKAVFEEPSMLLNLYALPAGTKIWVCIPRVVKFFHKLPASLRSFTLPDKDAGSTLKASPTVGGKAYENDWIVALYMGVDKDATTPTYHATGNLIATKTNSTVSFHIATLKELKAEAVPENYMPTGITLSASDGYADCAPGSQWDKFGCDITGLKTSNNGEDYTFLSYEITFSGDATLDIARAQLGGNWRLPSSPMETRIVEDRNDLRAEIQNWMDGTTYIGRTQTYTITYAPNAITNTLAFPITGLRKGTDFGNAYDPASGAYWSGQVSYPCKVYQCYFSASVKEAGWDWKELYYGLAVRPVTE